MMKIWINHWQSTGAARKTANYPNAIRIYCLNLQQHFLQHPSQSCLECAANRISSYHYGITLQATPNVYSCVRRLLKSTQNKFGMFQQYHATHFPDHDPNENIAPAT
jgi:hypothetical protein